MSWRPHGEDVFINSIEAARPTADIDLAISRVHKLPCIGYCPAAGDTSADIIAENLAEVDALCARYERVFAFGHSILPFRLLISRRGCEYTGVIQHNHGNNIEEVLERWYTNATISGYGDVRDKGNKIDPKVHDGRELSAAEFGVESIFLQQIEDTWKRRFKNCSQIRVEPYKIHIYGPGGHFKMHCNSPQKTMIGTFSVGLGDTTKGHHVRIVDKDLDATPGSWCAFYSDVPHEVTTIENGYCAVLVLKIIRVGVSAESEAGIQPDVFTTIHDIVTGINVPYGILLGRKYCLGKSELSEMDSLVTTCARAQPNVNVHLLPVIAKCIANPSNDAFKTWIYPFTEAGIDYLLNRTEKIDYHWLRGADERVPFYCADFDGSVVDWSGNQQESEVEDSVYISYAVLVLPC